jgi:uncharacterized protein YpmB
MGDIVIILVLLLIICGSFYLHYKKVRKKGFQRKNHRKRHM